MFGRIKSFWGGEGDGTRTMLRTSTLLYTLLIILVLAFAASLILVYAPLSLSGTTDRLKRALPYPVVLVGYRDGVMYRTLSQNIASVKRFYEAQDFSTIGLRVDFSTEEGQKRFQVREKEVLNKMIEDKAVEALARKRGIRVNVDEATQGVARTLEEYGSGEQVKQDLERLYGWTLADFEEKVVIPSLYQEKLQAQFMEEVDTASAAQDKIHTARRALQSGEKFADVAKKYSEGSTAQDGGALGWFALQDLAPELRQATLLQAVDIPGDVIESNLGFHILLVEETKKENQKQLYRLRQIFTKKTAFSDWLAEQMRGMPILVLSPEYRWNKEEARVEFRSSEMRDFEEKLFEQSEGDPTFFF